MKKEPAWIGHCTYCGKPCYAQSICDTCDREQELEDSPHMCRYCGEVKIEEEHDICPTCTKEHYLDIKADFELRERKENTQ